MQSRVKSSIYIKIDKKQTGFAPNYRANLVCFIMGWRSRINIHRPRVSQVSVAQPYVL